MPLEEVVKTYGLQELVPEHASDEQFYFAQKIHLGEPLYERALTLGDGEVSDPVAADDGIHVVQMVKHVKPLPLTFERVRSQVLNDYVTAAKKRLEDADLRYLREKADILIADDYAADYEKSQAEKTPRPQAGRLEQAMKSLARLIRALLIPLLAVGPGFSLPASRAYPQRDPFGLADPGHHGASAIHRAGSRSQADHG